MQEGYYGNRTEINFTFEKNGNEKLTYVLSKNYMANIYASKIYLRILLLHISLYSSSKVKEEEKKKKTPGGGK